MTRTRRASGERGVALVMTGLVLVPLMIFAAFGVDLASWYSRISYLQKSADAAALAGTVWMPDLTKATEEAKASLRENGIVDKDEGGTDDIDVVVARGSRLTSLRVVLTDNSVTQYFASVLGGSQSLSRSAEAEYNLPIPLGSPLNYFGGDHTRTAPPPTTTYSVSWPGDYTTRAPANAPCNVGTSSAQGLGRWIGSPPTYQSGHSGGSTPQCRWGSTGTASAGSSAVPPPDYSTRVPTNGTSATGCRVLRNGVGPSLGRWQNSSFAANTGGTAPACTWPNLSTDPSTILPDATTRPPSNRPCRIGYETSGPGGGWWPVAGSLVPVTPSPPAGGSTTEGNVLCRWLPQITSSTTTPPNPIDPTRSPGFWAMIEGPASVSPNGDAYNTRCYLFNNCAAGIENVQHKPASDLDRGFWYVVKIPAAAIGPVDIRVFDASYNAAGTVDVMAGDRNLGGATVFPTQFRVFVQNNPLDFSDRTPVGASGTGNQTEGSCFWDLADQVSFRGQWRRLCTISAPIPGGTYLVNVQTTGTVGNGINGYALEAVASGGTQPAVYAYASMGMQNNNTCSPSPCAPPPATFYLAEVGPQYAGKTLVIDLWDPGDATGNASVFPKRPSPLTPRPVVDVPAAECEYRSSPSPSAAQNSSHGGPTGVIHNTPQASDFASRCGIRTTIGGSRQFNGEWLMIRVAIPASYTCTLGVNPETTAGSCWWGIEYNFSSSANDVTTWRARIEGNPVHLTQ